MKSRYVSMASVLSLVACDPGPTESLRLNAQVRRDGVQEPFSGRLAVAWFQGDDLALDVETAARPSSSGAATIELTGAPTSRVQDYLTWHESDNSLRLGVLAAIDDAVAESVDLTSETPTVGELWSDERRTKVEAWCEEGAELCLHVSSCEDVDDECYRNFYECSGSSDADCRLTRTEGQPYHANRWGKLSGLAEEYLVVHTLDDMSERPLAAVGLYVGPLAQGYHLVRGRKLVGEELEASQACWTRAKNHADEFLAGEESDEIDIDALLLEQRAPIGSDESTWWDLVAVIGTLELHCPVHHVRYELTDPAQTRIDVRLSSMAKPLFPFVHPRDDLAMYDALTAYPGE